MKSLKINDKVKVIAGDHKGLDPARRECIEKPVQQLNGFSGRGELVVDIPCYDYKIRSFFTYYIVYLTKYELLIFNERILVQALAQMKIGQMYKLHTDLPLLP